MGNHGCHGGKMDFAFEYEEDHVVCTEESYPYTGEDGTCQKKCTEGIPSGAVTGFKDVSKRDGAAMMSAVAQQPISVAIDASGQGFSMYKSGVLTDCGQRLNHGVLAVGYGSENGSKYWIVKNS